MYPPKPLKLLDCARHGVGTELFIVEGDSAAGAVARVRDEATQAVLPMQGKPLNALKAGPAKTRAYPLFAMLVEALGTAEDLQHARYERVVLLMDPDADGIHCGALMLLFFLAAQTPWLEAGRVLLAQAPLASIASASFDQPVLPHTDAELRSALAQCQHKNITDIQTTRFRGLAGIDLPTLAHACVHPQTRRVRVLSLADAQAAADVFGGTA
jgi:DNA gyrase subunit B